MNNSHGRTSTIFIILIALLLISSTAIGFFMYQKESQIREGLEMQLGESKKQQEKISIELVDAKKQLVLLQDKNKEADAKINNLMDEIELNEGLRTELKKENSTLKDLIEAVKKEKEAFKAELENKSKRLQESQNLLKSEQEKTEMLQARIRSIDHSIYGADSKFDDNAMLRADRMAEKAAPEQIADMDLDKIIIGEKGRGIVLSVDKESEFIICSVGTRQGVKLGDTLAVFKRDEYLGDVKISRVQEEMSAADFVPPLSSRNVQKNYSVVLKQP